MKPDLLKLLEEFYDKAYKDDYFPWREYGEPCLVAHGLIEAIIKDAKQSSNETPVIDFEKDK